MHNPAFVLNSFETGLGVIRALGRLGIDVYAVDFKKDIGAYSRYAKFLKVTSPQKNMGQFLKDLIDGAKQAGPLKPILFLASDLFVNAVSENKELLEEHFLFNIPDKAVIESVADKLKQYELCTNNNIPAPLTYHVTSLAELVKLSGTVSYPVFIKGLDVTSWRYNVDGTLKGYTAGTPEQLVQTGGMLLEKGVPFIIQDIIPGNDEQHYKYCAFRNKAGEITAEFTLQKMRQLPIHFGVGSAVRSIENNSLKEIGRKLFHSINYTGTGSAEFKFDERDSTFKLIELNPRYWQQNSLAEAGGINIAYADYCSAAGIKNPEFGPQLNGKVWVNIYMDFSSFRGYKEEGSLTLKSWMKSLSGEKVFSDWASDDLLPGFYEFDFGKKFITWPLKKLGLLKK